MKKLKDLKWKAFDINTIFPEIQRGKRLKSGDHIKGQMAYISSSSINNGVDNFIGNDKKVRIFRNCLTLANSGSVGTSFYHPYGFVASDHVTKLKNAKFNKYVYLFLATVSNRLSEKYSFNREINDKRLRREFIMLPVKKDDSPDYEFMEQYMKKVEAKLLEQYKKYIDNKLKSLKNMINGEGGKHLKIKWKDFLISHIFNVYSSIRLTNADKTSGHRPFVGASDSNNGITSFVSNTNESLDRNVLGVNYNGSVVENFYHPYEAIFSDDVKRLHLKYVQDNKYICLFIKNSILKQKIKFEYGYKFNAERMHKTKIMLPIDENGNPNYKYMDNKMKEIEYLLLSKYISKKLI